MGSSHQAGVCLLVDWLDWQHLISLWLGLLMIGLEWYHLLSLSLSLCHSSACRLGRVGSRHYSVACPIVVWLEWDQLVSLGVVCVASSSSGHYMITLCFISLLSGLLDIISAVCDLSVHDPARLGSYHQCLTCLLVARLDWHQLLTFGLSARRLCWFGIISSISVPGRLSQAG